MDWLLVAAVQAAAANPVILAIIVLAWLAVLALLGSLLIHILTSD